MFANVDAGIAVGFVVTALLLHILDLTNVQIRLC